MSRLVFFLILVVSLSSYARHEGKDDNCGTKGVPAPTRSTSMFSELNHAIKKEDLKVFANNLCYMAEMSYGHDDAAKRIEDQILAKLKVTRNTPNYKQKILKFWNNTSPYLVCTVPSKLKPHARTPQHFMKRVLDLNMELTIFDEFLLYDSEELPINVNAVETINGKRETVLDYLDSIINDKSKHKYYQMQVIRDLREILIDEYGAKKAIHV